MEAKSIIINTSKKIDKRFVLTTSTGSGRVAYGEMANVAERDKVHKYIKAAAMGEFGDLKFNQDKSTYGAMLKGYTRANVLIVDATRSTAEFSNAVVDLCDELGIGADAVRAVSLRGVYRAERVGVLRDMITNYKPDMLVVIDALNLRDDIDDIYTVVAEMGVAGVNWKMSDAAKFATTTKQQPAAPAKSVQHMAKQQTTVKSQASELMQKNHKVADAFNRWK